VAAVRDAEAVRADDRVAVGHRDLLVEVAQTLGVLDGRVKSRDALDIFASRLA
jgi:hypothetical protein